MKNNYMVRSGLATNKPPPPPPELPERRGTMEGYVELLKKALAAETETVRLYTAILALAPQKHVTKLLEINADETDHQSILTDMLVEALTGQSADQEKLVPGVR
jgi:rubrerythrin